MELKVIAYARNGHTDKFGIPRQSREESPIVTRIVFEPEYSVPEALRGIEGFSHLWLLWGFSKADRLRVKGERDEWSPTVRPPRLGGNTRMGVFATRSPYRPNPIGMSSVRLLKVIKNSKLKIKNEAQDGRCAMELLVSGADLLDGTPIYDIKPYLSYSDSHPEAINGFAEAGKAHKLAVRWEDNINYLSETDRQWTDIAPIMDREWLADVAYILSQDPRPGYQDDPAREYKMDYAGWTVSFRVEGATAYVLRVEKT